MVDGVLKDLLRIPSGPKVWPVKKKTEKNCS
jgi:hypothetical protein